MESPDRYFKVEKYYQDNGFHDIYFEVNDLVIDYPESVIELKNDFESFIKVIALLFKNDLSSYTEYYDKIFRLADLAFNGSSGKIFLAKNSLDNLKIELVHEVGPSVRTTLLFKFIRVSAIPIIILVLFSIGIYLFETNVSVLYVLKLLLVAIGANIGCWLSLAVRTRGVEFDQILPLLSDHRGVHSRIVFVMIFSVVMAILMKSGLLSITLGEFSSVKIETQNYAALSAGIIMGFAEKLFVDKFNSKINTVKM
ncbi:hypothetical protein VXS04_18375 [Photobacterium piscicola]|uniref:hypothetical protein n=1 Tax=Photobacterium piscicola TaxID=1378299 RepID=UPI002E18D27E|nr:hypothetical protein [Photobacterium piscicola]